MIVETNHTGVDREVNEIYRQNGQPYRHDVVLVIGDSVADPNAWGAFTHRMVAATRK